MAHAAELTTVAAAVAHIRDTMAYLVTSRPTAVNLADSEQKINAAAATLAAAPGASGASVVEGILAFCEGLFAEDVATNKAIGSHGSKARRACLLLIAAQTGERASSKEASGVCFRIGASFWVARTAAAPRLLPAVQLFTI